MINLNDFFHVSKKLSKREEKFLSACCTESFTEMEKFYKSTFFNSKISLQDSYDYLFSVIHRNSLNGVKFLLEHGMNPNEHIENISYYLIFSIDNNNIEIIKLLLQHGLNLKQHSTIVHDVLVEKSKTMNIDILKLFIDSGLKSTNFLLKASREHSPFNQKDLDTIEYMVHKGHNIHTFIPSYMSRAILSNDLNAIKKFIDLGAVTYNNDKFLFDSFLLSDISISQFLFLQYPNPHDALNIINQTKNFSKLQWFQSYVESYDLTNNLNDILPNNQSHPIHKRLKL